MAKKRRGNPNKRKGTRIENEIVEKHLAAGLQAKRMPGSGQFGGEYSDDLRVLGDLHAEVKSRKNGAGFKTLEGWLGTCAMIFLRRNHAQPMVVMPWDTYVHLIKLIPPAGHLPSVTTDAIGAVASCDLPSTCT